jgi:hypothetical protein
MPNVNLDLIVFGACWCCAFVLVAATLDRLHGNRGDCQ